jgi:hypothetical protein
MVHTGEYNEPLSNTAGSDGKFRGADYSLGILKREAQLDISITTTDVVTI